MTAKTLRRWGVAMISAVLLLMLCGQSAARELLTLELKDAIGPAVAEQVTDALQRASEQQAVGIIILLDTPGGNAESMRRIVQAMYASDVPVIVYVSPSGARAASAGVMITMAADVAAMAPGTNIGAASPVGGGGQEIEKTMAKKVTNDMVAFSKGIARRRGRNVEWIEQAVREAVSVTATEALEKNIVDVVAEDLEDLIKQIDGRELAEKGQLDLSGVTVTQVPESRRTKILKIISDPNIAYILFMIGLAGLYFELSHPRCGLSRRGGRHLSGTGLFRISFSAGERCRYSVDPAGGDSFYPGDQGHQLRDAQRGRIDQHDPGKPDAF